MSDTLVSPGELIATGAILSVRFFNGRMLTGEDLTREQQAHEAARLRLGRARGEGIASGLHVARVPGPPERPVVRVDRGLAVNRRGRVLELPDPVNLALTREPPSDAAASADLLFSDCAPLGPGTSTDKAGVYLLAIAPAQSNSGRAPVSGLGNAVAACNVAFSVEGVQFRLLRLQLPTAMAAAPLKLRNRVAHLMLGTDDPDRRERLDDPLGPAANQYGGVDALRGRGSLGEEELAVATLRWTADAGIAFVDPWAVRRRIVEPVADERLPLVAGDRRRAEGEAAFHAFQHEVAERMASPSVTSWRAQDSCDYLPAVGIVPMAGGQRAGVDASTFLGALGSDELPTLHSAHLRELVQASFDHDPIRLADAERIQRYELSAEGLSTLVFARHTLPYRGVARYGRARYGRTPLGPTIH